jgi:hypothetical protein
MHFGYAVDCVFNVDDDLAGLETSARERLFSKQFTG